MNTKHKQEHLSSSVIFFTGWVGVLIALAAIVIHSLYLFIISQFLGTLTAFLYNRWLMKKNSWDNWVSLVFSLIALVTRNEWVMYAATVVRSISYQLIFYRLVRAREEERGKN